MERVTQYLIYFLRFGHHELLDQILRLVRVTKYLLSHTQFEIKRNAGGQRKTLYLLAMVTFRSLYRPTQLPQAFLDESL